MTAPYLVAGCPFVPPGGNGPCVTAQWVVAATRVFVAGQPGADFQLDLTLTGDFKDGGITFSMPFDNPPKPYKRSSTSDIP